MVENRMLVPEIDKKLCAYVAAVWVCNTNQGYTVGTVCKKQFVYKKSYCLPVAECHIQESTRV
jgi:hypothetical protein